MKPFAGITADVHSHNFSQYSRIDENGVNSRLKRTCEALHWAMQETLKAGAKKFIVAGDLFHVRREVPTVVLDMTAKVLEANRDLDIYLLVGNHDLNSSSDHNSVSALSGLATIVDKPCVHDIAGIKVGFIPWVDDQTKLKGIISKLYKAGARHLVGHLGIDGAKLGPSSIEIPGHVQLEGIVPSDVKWVALGHYHKPQVIHEDPHIRYVGSPLQHGRGERNEDKGFVLAYQDKLKFIENTFSPRFIDVEEGTDISAIRSHDYVKIVGKSKTENDTLLKQVADVTGGEVQDAVLEVRTPQEMKQRLKLTGLENKKMLDKYIEHKGVPEGVDATTLRNVGLQLLTGA
jgi:DNA repair exonuclease SbcCD nuclease subunit